jgi:aminoglycoside phosphotransferase (APT) family kinase protein
VTDEPEIEKEAGLLGFFHGRIGVPRVIGATETVLILEYAPHEELPATTEAAAQVGRTAAILHAARMEDCFPGARFDGVFAPTYDELLDWGERGLKGRAGLRLGALADEVHAAWSAHEEELRATFACPGLVHGDFKPANVKWRPDRGEVVVFDWEFAWYGATLMDLGQFLRWNVPEPFAAALARSYVGAGGSLPSGWRRTAALLDLFNLVHFVREPGEHPRRYADVLARVRRTLADVV